MSVLQRVPGSVGVRPARTFPSAYLTAETGFNLGANDAVTIAGWWRFTALAFDYPILASLGVGGSGASWKLLLWDADATRLATWSNDSAGRAVAANATTAGVWLFAAAQWASGGTSRTVWQETASVTNGTTVSVASAPNRLTIGADPQGGNRLSGDGACVGVWARELSAAEMVRLAGGTHPSAIQTSLLECWDLDHGGPIIGRVRGTILTPTNGGGAITPGPQIQGPPRLRRWYVDSTSSITYDTFRPSGTLSAGTWAPYPSGTLYGVTSDEDDATYAESSTGSGTDTLDLSFPSMSTPPAGTVTFYVRHQAGDDSEDITGSGDLEASGGSGSGSGTVT